MSSDLPKSPLREELSHLRDHWLLLLLMGIMLVIVGVLAISFEFITALATMAIFGMLLLIGGILEIVGAMTTRHGEDFWINLLTGVLSAVVGLLMMMQPGTAATAVTLMLAAAFIVGGILRIVYSSIERFYGWPWQLLNGFITLFLGIVIWRHFPSDSLWIIGLFVGIDLIFAGWTWIFLAIGVLRNVPKHP
jgi:uncharacterized membrane protein HdeD (DUF308 family)